MRRLAVILNDPVDRYLSSGYGAAWLKAYFNPGGFFDEVYSLAPYEHVDGALVGLTVIPTEPSRLHERLRALRIDVVRAYGGFQSCAMACRDKVSGVPVVVSVHDTSPSLLDPAIVHADVVLCVSAAVERLVAAHTPDHARRWRLPNRVDFSAMRRDAGTAPDLDARYPFRYRILHVGRKTRQKNLDTLIAALALLGDDYCLLAVGQGKVDEYVALAMNHGVSERCFFIPTIANEDLPRYFSWADCMCNPSRWEGMSIVLIEALASAAILVVSNIPEISETVTHGLNGLLVEDFENPAAIASAIRTACTDANVRRTLRANARSSVEQFERGRIDALEAGYYRAVLEMRKDGLFAQSFPDRVRRSAVRHARQVVPAPVRAVVRSLVQRRHGVTQ